MPILAKIDPIDKDIELIFREDLSPAARQASLVSYAYEQLSEAQASNERALGTIPEHETFVDGRRGAAVESVRPDGAIIFEFDLLNDLFAWIGEQLVLHAPILTGRYQRSFVFFADGVEIDPGAEVPQASEWVFLNTQPYARKIERGLSTQAPDGVFQVVAALAAKRFGNLARIRFSYRLPVASGATSRREKSTAEHNDRQPVIVVQLK